MRKSYLDDLTEKEWAQIEPILQEGVYRKAGAKGKYSRREMLNAIFYILRTGCRWRDLPRDFPPGQPFILNLLDGKNAEYSKR